MSRSLLTLSVLVLLLVPQAGYAYTTPEVLLNEFLPPASRHAEERTALQAQEAAARREREQEAAFALQRPPEPEVVEEEEPMFGAAPTMPAGYMAVPIQPMFGQPSFGFPAAPVAPSGALNTANLELMRTMRLLNRVQQNQSDQAILHHAATLAQLHGGAPPLTDTGAGAVLATMTALAAMGYTLVRARRSEHVTQAFHVS